MSACKELYSVSHTENISLSYDPFIETKHCLKMHVVPGNFIVASHEWVCLMCEPASHASHASHTASHAIHASQGASHASHRFNVKNNQIMEIII